MFRFACKFLIAILIVMWCVTSDTLEALNNGIPFR